MSLFVIMLSVLAGLFHAALFDGWVWVLTLAPYAYLMGHLISSLDTWVQEYEDEG